MPVPLFRLAVGLAGLAVIGLVVLVWLLTSGKEPPARAPAPVETSPPPTSEKTPVTPPEKAAPKPPIVPEPPVAKPPERVTPAAQTATARPPAPAPLPAATAAQAGPVAAPSAPVSARTAEERKPAPAAEEESPVEKALKKEGKFTFVGRTVKQAVEEVAKHAGVKAEFDDDAGKAVEQRVSTVVSGTAQECLEKLLHPRRLDYDVTEDGIVIGERTPEEIAEAARERAAAKAGAEPKPGAGQAKEPAKTAPRTVGWKVERRLVTVATPEGDKKKTITYYVNSIGMKFVKVPAGEFFMGDVSVPPRHPVRITKSFYVGAFEVTQGQWEAVMGTNPARFTKVGKDGPVEQVSWGDCQDFIKKLCEREGVPEGTYRLPTEAEWEYACRAGSSTSHYSGNSDKDAQRIAWYDANSQGSTRPVGGKLPNAFGLYDMSGNVSEWCQSLYQAYPYRKDDGRESLRSDGARVLRGGSWFSRPGLCRSAVRFRHLPVVLANYLGFRVVME